MKRLGALALVGLVGALLLTWAAPARAADVGSISEFGWWTKRPGAQPVVNGFEVASGPDGEESVAAFRVNLTGSVSQATLSFVETTNPNLAPVSGTPAINVCVTTVVWAAESDADFAKAPKQDCSAAIPMTVNAKGGWSADVTALLTGKSGTVSLMAVPDLTAAGPLDTGFNRQFGPPRVQADGTANPTPNSSSSFTPSASQQFPATQVFPTPPPVPVPLNPNGTISAPASAPTPTTQGNITTGAGVTIGLAHHAGDQKHWARLMLYIPLAAFLAIAYTLGRKAVIARGLIPSGS